VHHHSGPLTRGAVARLQTSQEEVGYPSKVSRQRVNQPPQSLGKAGLVRVEYGAVTVLDLDGLARHPS